MSNSTSSIKVFYEVVKRPQPPEDVSNLYFFLMGSDTGSASNYEHMIQQIKDLTRRQALHIELIEVESLAPLFIPDQPVTIRQNANTSKNEWEYPTIASSTLRDIFLFHKQKGVPVHLSVMLACKLLKINIGNELAEMGVGKNYLSDTLNGRYPVNELVRARLTEKLGLDPWSYSPIAKVAEVRRDIIPINR